MTSVMYDQQAFTRFRHGGIEKYFAQLATGISSVGWKPELSFHFGNNEHYFDLGGKKIFRTPGKKGGSTLSRKLNRITDFLIDPKFDVWHSTFYDESYLNMYDTGKMICTIHDMIPEIFPDLFDADPHLAKSKYASEARRLIAVSECTKSDLVKYFGIEKENIDVIYHGIDARDLEIEEFSVPDAYILFIGSRANYKNFNVLVQAFKRIKIKRPDLSLLCIGKKFEHHELEFLAETGVTDVFQASATDAQVRYALNRALFFVYPSLYEGFGIPLLEAMVQGTPMVISNASCFPEIARDSAIYFDPNDVFAFEEAMSLALVDRSLVKRLTMTGRELVKEYSIGKMLAATAGVYRRVKDES